jgi:putative transcriptional regulator
MTPDQIKDLRKRLGLSTMALAIRLGVSVDTVRSWEQGVRTPRPAVLSLLRALDASTAMPQEAVA